MHTAAALALALMVVAPTAAAADWLQNGYHAAHTNDSPDAGPATDDVAWRVHLGGSASTFSPTVIIGGDAYVRTFDYNLPGESESGIYRVNLSTGKSDLVAELHDRKYEGSSFASDGKLLFVTLDGGLAAYRLTGGAPVWTQPWPVAPVNERFGTMCGWLSVHEGSVYAGCALFSGDPTSSVTGTAGSTTFCAAFRASDGAVRWVWDRDSNGAAPSTVLPALPEPPTGSPTLRAYPVSVTVLGQTVLFATLDIVVQYQQPTDATVVSGGTESASYFALSDSDGHLLWAKNNSATPFSYSGVGPAGTPNIFQGGQLFSYPAGTPSVAYLALDVQPATSPATGNGVLFASNSATGNAIWSEALGAEDASAQEDSNGFALAGDALYTASAQTLYRFNATNHASGWRSTLDPSIPENFVSANLVLANGTLYAESVNLSGNSTDDGLYAYRASDGQLLWHRQLHLDSAGWGNWPGANIAVGDGLLLIGDVDGNVTAIGHTAASLQPSAKVSDTSPDPGRAVTVDLSAPGAGIGGAATSFRAVWGDGTATGWQTSPLFSHAYARAGDYRARFIARNAANQTASAFVTFNVGAPRPVPLNAAQQALAPENQNFTFFVIGAIGTLIGAIIGALRLRRKRRALARELKALEAVYATTRDRPAECDVALGERKARARGLLVDGKLDEGQFQVLERRIEELARTLRLGELDRRFEFLPMGMVNTLREMLKDGTISAWEHRHFVDALERDALLTPEQKTKVRSLIDGWFAHDSGVTAR
ncbi:MAG: outer membrane protein assembly factor BamB family protein [Thermoplasmatota archaeon]